MLSGLRIVEIQALGPAPFAAMHLADLGAEVIVIHRNSANADVVGDGSLLDRGKRSIVLDLKAPKDRDIALDLIDSADALIEGFRPGVMERLGLGPKVCHTRNPKLVYGRMTGWGQTGPRAHQAGHDLNYIATSGALWYASPPGTAPQTPPTLVGDIGGGAAYLVIGLLAGLWNARATGKGTVVDAAIVDGSAHMMNLLMAIRQGGQFHDQRGISLLDGPHWSRTYLCKDGNYVSVQCLEPKFYREFLRLMQLDDDPAFDNQFDRAAWPQRTDRLQQIFVTQPAAHWQDLFQSSDACVAAVQSPSQSKDDPHMAARKVWASQDDTLQAAPAPRFDGQLRPIAKPPARDAHRAEILAALKRD